MSGQQIGTAVGFVAGFWLPGGPQVWAGIGGMVGGAIDPTTINGPDLGDAKQQLSQAGVAIAKIYGMPAPFAGTIIDGDPVSRKYTKTEKQGKGGGPEVKTQGFRATRAILVGEGEIEYARIFRNNKLVYSTIAGDQLDADSAGFASQLRLYTGTETQLPDPSLEAIHGVGNTPYYRGRAYVVIVDDDETQGQGAANQYLFQVVSAGLVTVNPGTYDALAYSPDVFPWRENASEFRDPRKGGVQYDYGWVDPGFGYETANFGYSSPEAAIDAAIADGVTGGRTYATEITLRGWREWDDISAGGWRGADADVFPWSGVSFDANTISAVGLIYSRYPANIEAAGFLLSYAAITGEEFRSGKWLFEPAGDQAGGTHTGVWVWQPDLDAGDDDGFANWNGDDGISGGADAIRYYADFIVVCRPVVSCEFSDGLMTVPDAANYTADTDGNLYANDCEQVAGSFKQLALSQTVSPSIPSFVSLPQGPVLSVGDANDVQSFWDAAEADAVAAGTVPAGRTYQANGLGDYTTYPRVVSDACECSPAVPTISINSIMWKDIATDIVSRTPCPTSKLDIAHMTDEVPGFGIFRTDLRGTDLLRALAGPYFVSLPEYDDGIHAVRFGGAVVATLTEDDFLEVEEQDDDTRNQIIEAPPKAIIYYPDPANNYVVTPQPALRTSPDIQGTNELSVQTIIPFDATRAAQIIDITQKVAYSKVEGGFKRSLPAEYSRLVASDVLMYNSRRSVIDKISYEDCMVSIEASYDRASDYSSLALGANAPTPTPQASNIKGPTLLYAMNLPSLRTQDDTPGMYLVVQGFFAAWPGADIYLSVDGGVSEQLVATMTDAAVMGELAASCDEDGSDSSGLLEVEVYFGGELSSITAEQMATRQNGFALISNDIAEIGQFQTANETSTDRVYELTDVLRGQLQTQAVPHAAGDRFALLDGSILFLPIDIQHAGTTLIFRAVTLGTAPANNDTISVVYDPQFTSQSVNFYTDISGNRYTNASGHPYYRIN